MRPHEYEPQSDVLGAVLLGAMITAIIVLAAWVG